MSLPIKKIYVDTRYRTTDSISTSNFKIELPYSVVLPENSTFQLTDICIEHSWLTVETGINDSLYFYAIDPASGQTKNTIVVLPSANYTGTSLAAVIQTSLNNQLATGLPYISQLQSVLSADIAVNITRALTRLKSVFITFDGTRTGNSAAWKYFTKTTNNFIHPMNSSATCDPAKEMEFQIQIGSKLFPEYPVKSLGEAYYQLRKH